jgi:hypothetical protein
MALMACIIILLPFPLPFINKTNTLLLSSIIWAGTMDHLKAYVQSNLVPSRSQNTTQMFLLRAMGINNLDRALSKYMHTYTGKAFPSSKIRMSEI